MFGEKRCNWCEDLNFFLLLLYILKIKKILKISYFVVVYKDCKITDYCFALHLKIDRLRIRNITFSRQCYGVRRTVASNCREIITNPFISTLLQRQPVGGTDFLDIVLSGMDNSKWGGGVNPDTRYRLILISLLC